MILWKEKNNEDVVYKLIFINSMFAFGPILGLFSFFNGNFVTILISIGMVLFASWKAVPVVKFILKMDSRKKYIFLLSPFICNGVVIEAKIIGGAALYFSLLAILLMMIVFLSRNLSSLMVKNNILV